MRRASRSSRNQLPRGSRGKSDLRAARLDRRRNARSLPITKAAREGRSAAAGHRTARAGKYCQRRRIVHYRPASGTISPRHPLPDRFTGARPCAAIRWTARCNNAMGLWHLKRGEFARAETFFRKAIERLTRRNANPYDGEPFYNLGLCLRYLDRDDEAYDAFYKAVWNQAWMAAGYHCPGRIGLQPDPTGPPRWNIWTARSVSTPTTSARAILKSWCCARWTAPVKPIRFLRETLRLDPLDWWARLLHGENLCGFARPRLDLAHDLARAGFLADAIRLLQSAPAPAEGDLPTQGLGVSPMVKYTLGWLCEKSGDQKKALRHFRQAAASPAGLLFPVAAGGHCGFASGHARQSRRRPRALLSGQFVLRPPPPRRSHPPLGTRREIESEFLHRLAQSWPRLFQHHPTTGQGARRLRPRLPNRSSRCAPALRTRPALETPWPKTRRPLARTGKISGRWSAGATT